MALGISRRGGLAALALFVNALMFAVGLYFEVHPRDRHDQWSAAGVAAVALLNSAALTLRPGGPVGPSFVARLRRIVGIANALLLAAALVIFALEVLYDAGHAALHWVALVVPPLATVAALRTRPAPRRPEPALQGQPPA